MPQKVPTPEEMEKLQRKDLAPQIDEFLELCLRAIRKKHNANTNAHVAVPCKEFSPCRARSSRRAVQGVLAVPCKEFSPAVQGVLAGRRGSRARDVGEEKLGLHGYGRRNAPAHQAEVRKAETGEGDLQQQLWWTLGPMSERFLNWYLDSPENPYICYIMRGLPGSGKSYDAKKLAPEAQIFSTDKFFMKDGVYVHDPEKLNHYHNLCKGAVRQAMRRRLTPLVVDNTNVRVAEFFPFLEMCLQYDYRVEIKEPTSSWWVNDIAPHLGDAKALGRMGADKAVKKKWKLEDRQKVEQLEKAAQILFEKNSHNVPLDIIYQMMRRYAVKVSAEDMMKSILRQNNQ
jgi:NEDD4-binding protein 2